MATGHYRNGILLTPITADAIVAVLTGGAVPEPVRSFAPGRPGRLGNVAGSRR